MGNFIPRIFYPGGYVAVATSPSPSPKELLPTESSDISFFNNFFYCLLNAAQSNGGRNA